MCHPQAAKSLSFKKELDEFHNASATSQVSKGTLHSRRCVLTHERAPRKALRSSRSLGTLEDLDPLAFFFKKSMTFKAEVGFLAQVKA